MSFRIDSIGFRTRWMETRFPFKYGIAAMTELPHVFAHVRGTVDGKRCEGLASEGLPPKWFTKDPATTFEEDLPGMLEVIRHAARAGSGNEAPSVFAWWKDLYSAQDEWAKREDVPPLLAHLGTSMIERAGIDAACRGMGVNFAEAVAGGQLGIDPGSIHPELRGSAPSDWLGAPAEHVIARHTVGLGDPLRPEDIAPGEEVADELPYSLEDAVEAYGLTHFKIKVCGNLEVDIPRLREVAAVLGEQSPGYRFTLDGNEQYDDIAGFRAHWEAYGADPELRSMFEGGGLLFVEQPLHRDHALADRVRDELYSWPEAPPMIIDESDGEVTSLRRALELGYRGTSHKNCKGVFKGIANRCLIERHSRESAGDRPWVMSGEDLANVGPVALLNDLAVMAVLGIEDVERNGHHYFAGLSMYPEELQDLVCAAHPDLYARREEGIAALRIAGGRISVESVLAAPFGHGLGLNAKVLKLLGEEGLPG